VFYDIRVKERYNNQYTSISRVSSGCQRILFILALTMAAELNQIPLLSFEELENSVHPRLLQNLLMAVHSLAGDTKILITSHSPYLIKYLSPSQIYLGLPSENGVADFRMIKPSKVSKVLRLASSEEVSLGEYLFEMMLDMEDDRTLLNEYFG
jgi:predicted ATPase